MVARPSSRMSTDEYMNIDYLSNESAKVNSDPSADSFPYFSHLPTELRLKIWHVAFPSPRIVKVDYDVRSKTFFSLTPVPSILHVNREARYEALKVYKLSFATNHTPGRIYFNFDVDTVYLDACWPEIPMHDFCRHSKEEDRAKVTQLAIGDHFLLYADDVEDFATFKSLKRLSLVDSPGRRFHGISRSWYKSLQGFTLVDMDKANWKINPKITIQLIQKWYENWHETHKLTIPKMVCVALADSAVPAVQD